MGYYANSDDTELPCLFAGPQTAPSVATQEITVASGETIARGEAVQIDAGEVKSLTADTQDVYCIAAYDVDASDGAVVSVGYTSGGFAEQNITFGAGTADDYRDDMRTKNLYLYPILPAV